MLASIGGTYLVGLALPWLRQSSTIVAFSHIIPSSIVIELV